MTAERRRILVTSALPYANGPIHIGHLVEYLQTDIWVRFQKMRGHSCIYVCADDAHGTPIMLSAEKAGIEPQALIDDMWHKHVADFAEFSVEFDHYYTTHSDENRELASLIYERLRDGGHIAKRTIEQAYDEEKQMFLPGRYVTGTCPVCKLPDQYGISCDNGHTYSPLEMIDPISSVSGKPPVAKDSEHYFFKVGDFEQELRDWLNSGAVQESSRNKLLSLMEDGVRDWDISRDAPYWGFEIPDAPGKYFFVWLDAPIGYMASFRKYCELNDVDFDEYWGADSTAELYHFIGKDIVRFHSMFWPTMLRGAGYRMPTAVWAHGFLTVDSTKMSKSKGTFVMARTYLDHLNPEYLRYYYAAKLTAKVDDIDLNLEDFRQRVDSDLVNKFVNIASRCCKLLSRHFDNKLANSLPEPDLYKQFSDASDQIAAQWEAREYSKAIKAIMALADVANVYIDDKKPWALAKDEATLPDVQGICTLGLNMYRALMTYLKPVLPTTAAASEALLNIEPLTWDSVQEPLLDHTVSKFKPLLQRMNPKHVEAMVEASKPVDDTPAPTGPLADDPIGPEIVIDDFAKIDLRAARIAKASHVDGAKKLLQLTLDIGGETRNVFAGIKSAYPDPSVLEGKLVVLVANLKPRKMKFGVSEGMVLAAGPGGKDIFLLSPDDGAVPGMKIS